MNGENKYMQPKLSTTPKRMSNRGSRIETGKRSKNNTKEPQLLNKPVFPQGLPKPSQVPKIVAAIDFTNFEATINSKNCNKSFCDLTWLKDSVSVERIKRQNDPNQILSHLNLDSNSYINELALLFFKDWRVVKVKHTNSQLESKSIQLQQVYYEIDMSETELANYKSKNSLDFDFYLNEKLKYDEIVNYIKSKQISVCIPLFHVYPMEDVISTINIRPLSNPLLENIKNINFVIKPLHLSFDWGLHEPIFCMAVLYDYEKCTYISECYHFDLNDSLTLGLMGSHVSISEMQKKPKSCLFSTTYKSSNIHLLIVFSKCLRGNESDFLGPYINPMKEKDKEKYINEIEANIAYFGGYRQVFGFVALQVFDKDRVFKLNEKTILSQVMRWKVDKDLHWMIERYREFEKNPKAKSSISINFSMNVSLIKQDNESNSSTSTITEKPQPMISFVSKSMYQTLYYQNYLFLYPETVSFSRYNYSNARNILLEIKVMENDSNLADNGLPIIYGDSTASQFVSVAKTVVFYHSKKPNFFDQIKIKLPVYLNERHNIVVSFYHVSCSMRRVKPNSSSVTLLGRSVILLYPKRRIIKNGKYNLPIALNLPNSEYIKELNYFENGNVKWIENGKPLFSFSIRTLSTIYPQDDYLDELFKQYESFRCNTANHKELTDVISNLSNADFQHSMDYFPVTANILFYFILSSNSGIQTSAFLALINLVCSIYEKAYDTNYLASYVDYIFENFPSKILLNQIIVELWCFQLLQNNLKVEILKCSDFLFDILFKSMTLYLYDTNNLGEGVRNERFSLEFRVMMRRLIIQLGEKIHVICNQSNDVVNTVKEESHKYRKLSSINMEFKNTDSFSMKYYGPSIARRLIESIARFIRNLFLIFDRGMLLQIIQQFLIKITPSEETVIDLVHLKFIFIKAITEFDYYLLLNLPVPINLNQFKSSAEITKELFKTHFLAGLVITEVTNYLEACSEVRVVAICTLRDILWSYDHDTRLANPKMIEQIAQMYFPFVFAIIEKWTTMRAFSDMKSEEHRTWLLCFVWLIKNANISLFQRWWKFETSEKLGNFLLVLMDILESFEYQGASIIESIFSENGGLSSSSAFNTLTVSSIKYRFEKHRRVEPNEIKSAIESFYTKTQDKGSVTLPLVAPELIKKMALLSREVSINVLNVLLAFINDHRLSFVKRSVVENDHVGPEKYNLFTKSFAVYIKILAMNQTQDVYTYALLNLKLIVTLFQSSLFEYRTTVCGELTSNFIRLMNSRWYDLRTFASSALLLMIRHNHIQMGNFLRLKLLSTVAVSELFASSLQNNMDSLCEMLKFVDTEAVRRYSRERSKNNYLANEIKELTNRMNKIIMDNMKVKESSYDPESQADYYHSISQSYFDSPDLRIPELEKLAQLHFRLNDFEECAMVRVTQAILISEYLRLLNRQSEALPQNPLSVFPSLKPEISLPENKDLIELSQEICQTKAFSEDGFVHLLYKAIKSLKCKALYETCIEVYRLLLPIYQHHFNYSKQCECYSDLNQLCTLSMEQMTLNNRLFSQYYRVGFYYNGTELKELNELQFVYKESGETRLSAIQDRLKTQFGSKISPDFVHFVSNLKKYDRHSMIERHLYIQLMSLEPYFTPEESENRKTPFKLNWNIDKFIFETPIVNGELLTQQWKRKTIIKVDGAFPCLKKRLKVSSVEEIDLSPIETATENIIKKTQALYDVINTFPRNTKTLQRELQGSLLLQVNVGPSAIAEQFLKKDSNVDVKAQEQLSKAFLNFLTLLAEGLFINSEMISIDQQELQTELKNGYYRLKNSFCVYSNTPEDAIVESFQPETRLTTKIAIENSSDVVSNEKEFKSQQHH